ncbi:MAG: DUF4139 domain-containing protein [candidate division Zixibacteria bacterium]|nr:DUF4139 domain-containing protein [candidate division Zixibacteria bacterium]
MCLFGALFASSLAWGQGGELTVTVYNDGRGLVKDVRELNFNRGSDTVKITDVAAALDPTSVRFEPLTKKNDIDLLEQNFEFDLVGSEKLLNKYLDKTIDVVTKDQKVFSGKLLSYIGGSYVLDVPNGGIRMVNPVEVVNISMPELPAGFYTRPTLVWLFNSRYSGKEKCQVSYLTGNLGWHAEYVALVNPTDDRLSLSGWVSIDNRSGATYPKAKLKLVAGELHRAKQPRLLRGALDAQYPAAEAAPFEEKAFFEYHLYTLAFPTTLANNQIKQVALFDPAETPVKKNFIYDPDRDATKASVVLEFKNAKEAGLGMALPAGIVRIMKRDTDGSIELIGEDNLEHTPKDERVELTVGKAFDIACEQAQKDRRQISNKVWEEDWEISVRNHKTEPITVRVVKHFWGFWEIRTSSHTFTKKDASTAWFEIPVDKDKETKLTLTVRYQNK